MQRILTIRMFSLLMAGICSSAAGDNLFVVCHAGVALAAAEVRDVFLGEMQFFDTVRLVPVDNIEAEGDFLEKVLRMTAGRYATTWAKKSFRDGINPPAALANDATVLEFIKHTSGGCGYLAAVPPESVTLIARY